MLLQLLALAAVAVQGADPADALAGAHKSSIALFARDDGSMSLVGQLNEYIGGETVAEMSGEMCSHMISVERFEDTILRGTTTRARDYSFGDRSLVTDCNNIRGIHQNVDRVAEYTDSAKETTKLFQKFGLVDEHWKAGPLTVHLGVFGATQAAVAMMVNAVVLDNLKRLNLPWDLMFVPICFFGTYVLICIFKKGITYWKGKPYVNKIITFNEKRQMHAWLAYHMMQSCQMTLLMQMYSTVDPENIAAFVEGLKAAGLQDAPITRLPKVRLKKPPSQSKTTAMSDGDDLLEELDSDAEDELAAAEVVDDVDVVMATLGASFDASFRLDGTQKDWSQFRKERKDKQKKELQKVEETKVFDCTKAADDLKHIREVGYDGPTTKDDLRGKLEGLYKETNELEKKGIAVDLKESERLVQVVWAGTSRKKEAYFPPICVRDVPKPFHFQKKSLLNLAGVWLYVRTLAIFPLFCLLHTCREKWSSRKKYVRDGKFVLVPMVGVAAQTLVLVEPSAWLIWWFLQWLWFWLKQKWPSTMNGLPFVAALYILAADGVTLTRVKTSGAWRPGVAETPVMPEKMYLHSTKETYASATNKDGKGNVLDVIDAAVLNDFIKVDVRVLRVSWRWRGGRTPSVGVPMRRRRDSSLPRRTSRRRRSSSRTSGRSTRPGRRGRDSSFQKARLSQ